MDKKKEIKRWYDKVRHYYDKRIEIIAEKEIELLLNIAAPSFIFKMYGKHAYKAIISCCIDNWPVGEIWWHAEKVLKDLNDPSTIPLLKEVMEDEGLPDTAVQMTMNTLESLEDESIIPILIKNMRDGNSSERDHAERLLITRIERLVEKEDYEIALQLIKESTANIMKFYLGKRDRISLHNRNIKLTKLESLAQQIHDKMSSDKKRFPVKKQEIRKIQKRKIANS